jgi:hypothetical protein
LAKWHYQYLPGVYLGAYIKDEVIIAQNKKVTAKMQLTGPLRPYDATEGLKLRRKSIYTMYFNASLYMISWIKFNLI